MRPGKDVASLNDVWGWTDPQTGVEYALVGRHDGLSIVDLSTPVEPRPIAFLPSAISHTIWRDMKVVADHVYVVSESTGHGMQVLDLTRLRGLTEFTELNADARYQEVSAVHNLAINEETGFAYAVGSNSGGETCSGGLHLIDLSDPKNPVSARPGTKKRRPPASSPGGSRHRSPRGLRNRVMRNREEARGRLGTPTSGQFSRWGPAPLREAQRDRVLLICGMAQTRNPSSAATARCLSSRVTNAISRGSGTAERAVATCHKSAPFR